MLPSILVSEKANIHSKKKKQSYKTVGGVLFKADWALLTSKWNKKKGRGHEKKKEKIKHMHTLTHPTLWECGPSQLCGCPPTVHKGFCRKKKKRVGGRLTNLT